MSWTQVEQLSAGKMADRALPVRGLDRDLKLCTIIFFVEKVCLYTQYPFSWKARLAIYAIYHSPTCA